MNSYLWYRKTFLLINFFLSLNISDFSLFFTKKLQPSPLKKVTPLFLTNPPLKIKALSSPRFWKRGGGGVHTMYLWPVILNFSQYCSRGCWILVYCRFNSYFTFISKEKLHFLLTCSFYCYLLKGNWALKVV